ncbi:hypothetical protein PINS_up013965 [Pythium insidiosum]|nr:hypothetical protein PINS_up013965 [Pythium insidiosum]
MPSLHQVDKYTELVQRVAGVLLREAGYSMRHVRHAQTSELRQIVQHLLVERQAPVSFPIEREEEMLYAQVEDLLELEQSRSMTEEADALPNIADSMKASDAPSVYRQIALWKGDITTLKATAIVNAANSALLGCFQPTHRCIDNVIHCKAGPRLRAACAEIMNQQGHQERVGDAKITSGFVLPSTYVIHTVGPQLRRGATPTARDREQLQSCYTSSLDTLFAKLQTAQPNQESPVTVAFPCISTGLFAFPSDVAVPLAVNAVADWLQQRGDAAKSWKVIFNTFLQRDYELYQSHFRQQFGIEDSDAASILPTPVDPSLVQARKLIDEADYVLVSAGAGLSAAAGLDYTSEELMKKLHGPLQKVRPQLRTLYSTIGFSQWSTKLMWGYLLRHASIARFNWAEHRTAPTYQQVATICDAVEKRQPSTERLESKAWFVVTSNADGMFEQEGFADERVFMKQGEYGRIQCRRPCRSDSVFDVRPFMERALKSFNPKTYEIEDPAGLPRCPHCGGDMFLLLRIDGSFLESALDEGKARYHHWLSRVMKDVRTNGKKLVILEVGVGFNTPGVLRIPNERLATEPGVSLVRVNVDHPEIPFASNGVGVGVDANDALRFLVGESSEVDL